MKKFDYILLKTMTIPTKQFWWGRNRAVYLDFDFRWQWIPRLRYTVGPARVFHKIWPCWLQRHFERPQLFYLNTEVTVKQGFRIFW